MDGVQEHLGGDCPLTRGSADEILDNDKWVVLGELSSYSTVMPVSSIVNHSSTLTAELDPSHRLYTQRWSRSG
jgi:hypothetical protein